MAEDGLHGAQVGSIFDHVRGAGVAEHVGTGVASRCEAGLADQLPDALAGESASSYAQEQEWRIVFAGDRFPAVS